jgi:hypothetical protein
MTAASQPKLARFMLSPQACAVTHTTSAEIQPHDDGIRRGCLWTSTALFGRRRLCRRKIPPRGAPQDPLPAPLG